MTSADVVSAFLPLRVRVRDLGQKFRVVRRDEAAFDKGAALEVARRLGLTDVLGHAGGNFNGSAEFIGYKPGVVRRV